ncbi:hypothetical protein CANARDRAFT_198251 [[Candida] arabinofermentans NRRL YB-2248]|uniref:CoA-binding domain-containing protein n=1 Tax=[Candida] arabinofermentans NRRL YB-2248 TaxID=983967 RepID=A0A1E4T1R1_9ASCO|nr:hypothetical protein CANARDRAFT_198251 [[Candida] arabinofermentans NRRL YB-2248]
MSSAIANFFQNHYKRTYLVIGASNSPNKFGYKVLRWYIAHKLNVVPINPTSKKICDLDAFSSVTSYIDSMKGDQEKMKNGICLSVITPPEVSLTAMQSLKDYKDLVHGVWFQPGSYDGEVIQYCNDELGFTRANNKLIYNGNCILVSGESGLVSSNL